MQRNPRRFFNPFENAKEKLDGGRDERLIKENILHSLVKGNPYMSKCSLIFSCFVVMIMTEIRERINACKN